MRRTRRLFLIALAVFLIPGTVSAQDAVQPDRTSPAMEVDLGTDRVADDVLELRLIPVELGRATSPDLNADTPFHEPPRRAFLGLGRGARIGAIAGGIVVGTYGAVWYGRECEGGCRAPRLQGALIGGAVGALGGAIIGGLFDRMNRTW